MYSALRLASRSKASSRILSSSRIAINAPRFNAFTRTITTKMYTEDHETVIYDDETGLGTVTITEYAQSRLGDVVFVELAMPGTLVEQGDTLGAVESVKAASDIFTPLSGTIVEVNEKLNEQPGLLNKAPEEAGWLCKIKISDPKEMEDLMTKEDYTKYCKS